RVSSGVAHEPIAPGAQNLVLSQQIADAVAHVCRTQPERAAAFAAKLDGYERRLGRLKISDEELALFAGKRQLFSQSLAWAAMAAFGLPIAAYGWAHRLIPYALVKWANERFAEPGKRKAQASTTA